MGKLSPSLAIMSSPLVGSVADSGVASEIPSRGRCVLGLFMARKVLMKQKRPRTMNGKEEMKRIIEVELKIQE